MKEVALDLVRNLSDPSQKLNRLREYMQAMVLRSLHESEAFGNLAFIGGTALRFVHSLPRFSEDLDFSLEQPCGYRPEKWLKKVKADLTLAGFDAHVTWSAKTAVHKSWIKVAQILKDTGLASMAEQKLSIKLEIDSRPPTGATSQTGVIQRHVLLSLRYHNLPSLMAGKIHALLTRPYPKGRDWYDLVWYRAQQPPVEPNLEQLQHALNQSQRGEAFPASEWKPRLIAKVERLDPEVLVRDVLFFLERTEESTLLSRENLLSALR